VPFFVSQQEIDVPDDRFDLPHEETTGSRSAYDGGLVRLRVDDVRLPSGRQSQRVVVEHPGAVAVVALTADEQVILVRQWRHAIGRSLLEIPAGTREQGEPEVETAKRELIEETGYRAGEIVEIARFLTSAGYSNEVMTLFLATSCVPIDVSASEDERTMAELVPRNELGRLLAGADRMEDAKSLIGLLWLQRG
jgi:ADP-ribose pyrophosphatase